MYCVLLTLLAVFQLLPAPVKQSTAEGVCSLQPVTSYVLTGEKAPVLSSYLEKGSPLCALRLTPAPGRKAPLVVDISRRHKLAPEAYVMDIRPDGVTIRSSSESGAFYAVQSLYQLYNQSPELRCGHIEDAPAHPYRGLMLDVGRQMVTPEFLRRQVDAMAYLKLNYLHLHLTEDEGWRLQLDSHPELVRQSAFNCEPRPLYNASPARMVPEPEGYVPGTVVQREGCHGGYYSKAQMQDLVAYARLRQVEVLPEIEMPGHSTELFAARPDIFCSIDGKPANGSVCPGKDATLRFYEEVLTEVMEIFPCRYIHIGGEVVWRRNRGRCPGCGRRRGTQRPSIYGHTNRGGPSHNT